MKKYSVMVRGENFLVYMDGEKQLLNFVATRKVKAKSVEKAELKAIDLIKYDPVLLALLVEGGNDEPTLFIEEVAHLPWWARLGGRGYTFYTEKDD